MSQLSVSELKIAKLCRVLLTHVFLKCRGIPLTWLMNHRLVIMIHSFTHLAASPSSKFKVIFLTLDITHIFLPLWTNVGFSSIPLFTLQMSQIAIMTYSPAALWVLLPSFLPTPTEIIQQCQTIWSCSLFSDTWHILIDSERRVSSGFKIPIWLPVLAPTAS